MLCAYVHKLDHAPVPSNALASEMRASHPSLLSYSQKVPVLITRTGSPAVPQQWSDQSISSKTQTFSSVSMHCEPLTSLHQSKALNKASMSVDKSLESRQRGFSNLGHRQEQVSCASLHSKAKTWVCECFLISVLTGRSFADVWLSRVNFAAVFAKNIFGDHGHECGQ